MSDPDRTAFATLLVDHRQRLSLTQAALAARTEKLNDDGITSRAVTERTIVALERISRDRPRIPHQATVRALANALELEPGTHTHDTFIAMASDPDAVSPPPPVVEPDTEFISAGRESQLARLETAIDCAALALPSVVLLTGPAGIGKTRLLEEASRRGVSRHDSAVLLWGTCPRGFGTIADHEPWRAIARQTLRDGFASHSTALPAGHGKRLAARAHLAIDALTERAVALVGNLVPTDAIRHPELLDALPVGARRKIEAVLESPGSERASQETLDAALVQFLETYASAGPTILVLEDLHWADTATLATARHVVASLASRRLPVALLGSIRTGESDSDPISDRETERLIADVTSYFPGAVVELAPSVGGEAGRAFVDAAVATLGLEPLAEGLFARTGGMPLFVMGMLRLHAMDATAMTAGQIPAEIDAVFAQQLARLDERTRTLLTAASVQGDTFLVEPALTAAGMSVEEWSSRIDSELAGIIRSIGPVHIAPGVVMHRCRFAHSLLRDHVEATLSPLERSHLHRATANALECILGGGDHAAMAVVATHLEQGGELSWAANLWREAGDRAMLESNHRHALAIFRHIQTMGLERIEPDMHVQAQIGIGNCYRALGRPSDAREALQRARREAMGKHLHAIDANALVSLGTLDFDAGRMVAAAARFGQAIESYTRARDIAETARANASLSFALLAMARFDDARACADEGIALARAAGNASALASAEIAHTNCWLELGFYQDAIERYEVGLAHNNMLGLTHHANLCLVNILRCQIELGRWDDAEATLSQLQARERRPVDRMRSEVAFDDALIAEGRGDPERAQARYTASLQMRERLDQTQLVIDSLAGLLRIAVSTGDKASLGDLLTQIETRVSAQAVIGIEHVGRLHLAMFDGHGAVGNKAGALAWLTNGVALLQERASTLTDPRHRENYLTRPPSHRRILELARIHGVSGVDAQLRCDRFGVPVAS